MEKKKKKRESSPTATSSAPMAADWSQLPKELLQLISERLESELYLLRFRSVCSTWRSSIPSHRHHFATLFPVHPKSNNTFNLGLYKRSLFLITPPPHQQQTLRPWLIKIGPDRHGQTRLWHPLSDDTRITPHFHHVIDFNQLPVLDLGHEFVLHSDSPIPPGDYIYPEKVVAKMWLGKVPLVLFAIQPLGQLVLFRCGEEQWKVIPDPYMAHYVDICIFKGQPCAVDDTGRTVTVTVQPDLSVNLVAEPVFGGDSKYLVKSGDELLLVDEYDNDGDGDAVRIDVFRLDTREKKWVELTSLGDKVLFFAANSVFCASASDLCVAKGNCAIFSDMDDPFGSPNVLDLGHKGFIAPLANPDYSNLFWPPPDWVGLR